MVRDDHRTSTARPNRRALRLYEVKIGLRTSYGNSGLAVEPFVFVALIYTHTPRPSKYTRRPCTYTHALRHYNTSQLLGN